ncbi:MAG: hypothetical protein K8R23_18980 [Chthoniobacter sp.]|nr:hypothetical protein [Chthoniobacter sp.]
MLIDVLSLFPNIAAAPLAESILGRAQERGLITIRSHNLRDWATDKHRTTDDTPYGGSQGMVMKCEPIFAAVEELRGDRSSEFEKASLPIPPKDLPSPISDLRAARLFSSPPPAALLPSASLRSW